MNKLILVLFKIPDLRRKIWFTLMLMGIYRLGLWVPLPFVDQVALQSWAETTFDQSQWGGFRSYLSMFAGTDLGTSTIFGLGIMPYISASIIFQLLASAVPALEKLQKEGEVGRKKLNEYTRYLTVGICLLQSSLWMNVMMGQTAGDAIPIINPAYQNFYFASVGVLTMSAGSIFLMWLGEQIDEYGIGNGISLIIMAGIVGRLPVAIGSIWGNLGDRLVSPDTGIGIETLVVLIGLFLAVLFCVILITQGQRRIPIQSAKHVRGRRVFGGTRQYLPLRVNQAGVMPIIFASSLMLFPTFILSWVTSNFDVWRSIDLLHNSLQGQGIVYMLCYVGLIYFFCYFWTAITFNPKDMANNLKDYGSFIPGYRPGKRTADYLERVMMRITYVGAAFLSAVAIIPTLINSSLDVDFTVAAFFGGTGLLIIISVTLDLIQKIDSHLIMRNYDSLIGTATSASGRNA